MIKIRNNIYICIDSVILFFSESAKNWVFIKLMNFSVIYLCINAFQLTTKRFLMQRSSSRYHLKNFKNCVK